MKRYTRQGVVCGCVCLVFASHLREPRRARARGRGLLTRMSPLIEPLRAHGFDSRMITKSLNWKVVLRDLPRNFEPALLIHKSQVVRPSPRTILKRIDWSRVPSTTNLVDTFRWTLNLVRDLSVSTSCRHWCGVRRWSSILHRTQLSCPPLGTPR